ncbi:C6 finger domain protein [Aspergillus bombycis]|uniref:C6 finger domain protein n=1 Tax=Aspergillus bombycis TaxID=109264 RepID=A0A1F7ZRU0_9EURO|nr:C6 finger domain protein [Aspergillus bombycis]OGM42152.1 C6 finger domain protein [Aspergillus bombycis]
MQATAYKSKRATLKSAGGHIAEPEQCDEKRPTCTNCTTSERFCEYADIFQAATRSRTNTSPASSPAVVAARDQPADVASPRSDSLPQDAPVNMLHMQLLHHLMTETRNTFEESFDVAVASPDTLQICMSSPYVMNELLALSALHLSTLRPAEQEFYRRHAAQLQTHALTILNSMELELNQETCVPLFLFSGLLNVHLLYDVLINRNQDFDHFLDQLVGSFRLHRGIRAITTNSWGMLRESSLKALILDSEKRFSSITGLDPECAKLLALIKAAKLGPSITNTYKQAIESLQHAMASCLYGKQGANVTEITAWPILVSPEYIDLLTMRYPEALAVLAYYAACLHTRRDMWGFGDGGRFLVESIIKCLGPEWAEWLDWPVRVLNDNHQSS